MISKRCYLKIDSNKPLKDELDRAIVQSYENAYYLMKVLKSKIKGREYYAAVRVEEDDQPREIVCFVAEIIEINCDNTVQILITNEENLPKFRSCPVEILDMLTEASCANAVKWRRICYFNAENPALGKLPVGTRIRLVDTEIYLVCIEPRFRFKTKWWVVENSYSQGRYRYAGKKHIKLNGFEIIEMGNGTQHEIL